eukprot:7008066-Alexandrium_andersonii.AAC.1
MSASLVGSEMCIRDSLLPEPDRLRVALRAPAIVETASGDARAVRKLRRTRFTHSRLTRTSAARA